MLRQNILRQKVKRAKLEKHISYKELAYQLLLISYKGFCNWLEGYTNLSQQKLKILDDYLIQLLDN